MTHLHKSELTINVAIVAVFFGGAFGGSLAMPPIMWGRLSLQQSALSVTSAQLQLSADTRGTTMNIKEQKRHTMQCEINRLNAELRNAQTKPALFSKLNKRRSEILATARLLKIDIHAV